MFPLVSIIVPVYNVERYLDECLHSIRAQTYDRLEILVVEDCSTDDSLGKLAPHLTDPRVRLLRHERNAGLSAARNTGIEAASGDYVMFVDSDDLVDTNLVEACVSCAQRTNAEVVVYAHKPFMDGEVVSTEGRAGRCERGRPIALEYFSLPHFAWLKFMKRSLLRNPALRFPVGLYYEDWPFHWRLGLDTRLKVELDRKLYHYRQRPTSITGSTGGKLLDLFAIHTLVIEMLDSADDPGAGQILTGKIRDSHWSVLTRIEPELVDAALAQARRAEQSLRSRALRDSGGWRRRTIAAIVRLPAPLSTLALKALRATLGTLSAARRKPPQGQVTESLA